MMRRFLLNGTSPSRAAVEMGLRARGEELVEKLEQQPNVLICFSAGAPLTELWTEFAACLPSPERDASGELRASGAVIVIAQDSKGPALRAAVAEMEAACLSLAPKIRLNALITAVDKPEDALCPALFWLADAPAVTGRTLRRAPLRDSAPQAETAFL